MDSFVFSLDKVFLSAESPPVATLPSALSVSAVRPVQVGCSRFSRCCHLIVDLSFIFAGSWARRLTQSPELGVLGFVFFLPKNVLTLCCCRHRPPVAVVQRFVDFSAHPQVMQQHR